MKISKPVRAFCDCGGPGSGGMDCFNTGPKGLINCLT